MNPLDASMAHEYSMRGSFCASSGTIIFRFFITMPRRDFLEMWREPFFLTLVESNHCPLGINHRPTRSTKINDCGSSEIKRNIIPCVNPRVIRPSPGRWWSNPLSQGRFLCKPRIYNGNATRVFEVSCVTHFSPSLRWHFLKKNHLQDKRLFMPRYAYNQSTSRWKSLFSSSPRDRLARKGVRFLRDSGRCICIPGIVLQTSDARQGLNDAEIIEKVIRGLLSG